MQLRPDHDRGVGPELIITVGPNGVVIPSRPVDEEGADSILRSHLSTKRSHEIGHFGLGFKSVLGISERIAVFSRLGSFGFDTSAARARILACVPGYRKQTPGLRIAHALDAEEERARDPILDELAEWASTVIRLSRDHPRAQELGGDLVGFPAEFLLFSPHVTSLQMEDTTGDFDRLIVLTSGEDRRIDLDDTAGGGLDGLSDAARREVLDLLLEEATIDGENNVTLTLAIPADEEFVSIAKPEQRSRFFNPHEKLRYSWAVSLPAPSR